ncbi:putative S-adenosyl-L-methionine-dependent methyltransferase [Helianthus debilis subsp. tardiflorus]
MAVDSSTFETLTPSQFITFTLPNTINPHHHHHRCHLYTPLLRIAVLDSPIATTDDPNPIIAAMIVPDHRETDWNFCTESGHLQLLYDFSNISRLILIGNNLDPNSEPLDYVRTVVDTVDVEKIECELKQLVIALHPKICFRNGVPKTLFLTYEDDVLQRVVVKRFVGPFVGEFLVEDVQLESKAFRRRLRFKRMPNLIQSQVPVVASVCNVELGLVSLGKMKKVEFRVDTGTLVQPYLTPMVSGLFLIVSSVNERIRQEFSPRALCLGVGGGALLSFLNSKLGFEVVGVEADEVVLSVARGYFGLTDGKSVKLIVGDAIQLIGGLNDKFDVVMVDLDSSEARSGTSAPPLEFVKKSVFRALRSLVYCHAVIVINVISPNELFYETLVQQLQDVFHKVYAMDVKNDGNIVLMATVSPIAANDHDCAFSKRLRAVVSGSYMESIVEL